MGGNLIANVAARAAPGKGDLCTAISVAARPAGVRFRRRWPGC